ncbi:hypothetical protein HG421_09105 [Xanthomonas campestris pv. badrii]|uniref:Uncharacterized protein n=1 Tax=Xanthomonas campestris pv. badrii TaxID=149696 RepID=A0A7Z2VAM6_XANCA|nr:hypothetical protein [Xanthomonas campestris]MCC4603593.1 hypothetical protein [Xanthomonas campestris pv. parthenii]QJD67852.1 hypothetical protein HG421_09105 [Xanthomonas campestris pv. badrii]
MLMPVVCTECADEMLSGVGLIPDGGILIETRVVPVQTVGLYRVACRRGHNIVMIADFQQFELLFESALEAFSDTYFRESVSSFAASLERYYEFAIRTLLIERSVSRDAIDVVWKSVSRQSERQLGMFIGLYTAARGYPPKILSSDKASFRNSVIHNGHFPSPNEAFEFGASVYELLLNGIKELRLDFYASMQEARNFTREKASEGVRPGEVPAQFAMSTTISLTNIGDPLPMLDAVNSVADRLRRHRYSDNPEPATHG